VSELSTVAGAIADAARLGQPEAVELLAELIIATAMNHTVTDESPSTTLLATSGVLLGADREDVLTSNCVSALASEDGWTLHGDALLLGRATGDTVALLVATPDDGGGLLVQVDSARTSFEDYPVRRSDVTQRVDQETMRRVRHAFDVGAIAILVGVADSLRGPITLRVADLTLDNPDRWIGQSLKHRLADLTMRRNVAWLELARSVDGATERERQLHGAIGLHEALLTATSSLEEFTLVRASHVESQPIVEFASKLISLLDWSAGGRYRLKDRVFAHTTV
jgi:hypothetical protein